MSNGCDPVYPQRFAHAVGNYRTYFTIVPYDDAILTGMLPGDLELATQSITPAGTHPLVFLFGKHFDVRPNIIPFGGMTYLEYICAIPFVQWRRSSNKYQGPFSYMPRMYLNELIPTLLGYMYAYPKQMARMEGNPPTDSHYGVRTLLQDEALIEGSFNRSGPQLPPADFPNFANVRAVFEQPFVGKYEIGPYVCSKLTFKLDQAIIQSCTAEVEVERAFVPGLELGSILRPGIDTDPLGSFYMSVPWELTLPFGCDCIDCKQP